jgi:hypothetical protein
MDYEIAFEDLYAEGPGLSGAETLTPLLPEIDVTLNQQ